MKQYISQVCIMTIITKGIHASLAMETAPSLPKKALILTLHLSHPFQQICAYYFESQGNAYLTIAHRFSSRINM